ncbi:hypothetical protein HPG69_005099, partial [Diceros bicornis minor]
FTGKDQQPSGSEGDDDDVEAALKKEVGDLKASTEMRRRRFQSVESGVNNVVFIRTLGIGYVQNQEDDDLGYSTNVTLSGTRRAVLEDVKKYAETFLEPQFKDLKRDISGIVNSVNSENKVDLTNPQKYHLQEVVKSTKDPLQLNPKQAAQAGNEKEAKLGSGDTSNQNDPAEGTNNQQVVPENSGELEQTKPISETQVYKTKDQLFNRKNLKHFKRFKPDLGLYCPREIAATAKCQEKQQTYQEFGTNAEHSYFLFVTSSLSDEDKCQRLPVNKAWIQL